MESQLLTNFQAVYTESLVEGLGVGDIIEANDSVMAYVVNASTGAVTTYLNYNFNSFAKIGGRYFASGPSGIYELVGTTDAGTSITATVTMPTTDLETEEVPSELLKRVPAAYLGVTTTGDMLLRVTANGSQNTYTLAGTATSTLHTGRITLGQGVAARYWDFEISNVNGADFMLESVVFYPVALTRRIVRG